MTLLSHCSCRLITVSGQCPLARGADTFLKLGCPLCTFFPCHPFFCHRVRKTVLRNIRNCIIYTQKCTLSAKLQEISRILIQVTFENQTVPPKLGVSRCSQWQCLCGWQLIIHKARHYVSVDVSVFTEKWTHVNTWSSASAETARDADVGAHIRLSL